MTFHRLYIDYREVSSIVSNDSPLLYERSWLNGIYQNYCSISKKIYKSTDLIGKRIFHAKNLIISPIGRVDIKQNFTGIEN